MKQQTFMHFAYKLVNLVLAASVLFLAGCGVSGTDELTAWADEQRKQQSVRLPPIAEPKKFVPQQFTASETADPYNSQRLSTALKRELRPAVDTSALIKPELARQASQKQPLEGPPLDAMNFVGSIVRDGRPVAILKVNGLLHQVRVGDYLGQNFGKILRISDAEVGLREIVQDTEGEWSERTATLQLQQGAK